MAREKEDNLRLRLLEKLGKVPFLSTEEASELLGVSLSTTRRLFTKLEESNDILRVYGGIKINDTKSAYQYDKTYERDLSKKVSIGTMASSFVESGDKIYIDCGTTTVQMINELIDRIQSKKLKDVTVVTNSIVNLEMLAPYCDTLLVGGRYNIDRKSFSGYFSEKFVSQFSFNKSFIGVDGFTFEEGFATSDPDFARLSGHVASVSEKTFVLMDSSKIGRRSFVVYDRFKLIDRVIVDSKISDEDAKRLIDLGMDLYISKVEDM